MVKIVNGEVVDENAPPPPPSLASFGALSQRTLGGLSHYTIGGWLLLACVSFVLAGFRGDCPGVRPPPSAQSQLVPLLRQLARGFCD
ncbi:hypothetical protein T484DRAFT_2824024 [Baffinella frigidus]|nr:hypothetical protein T484DRAFT_2824024 [Cryptophyta sp. CCMP2293]